MTNANPPRSGRSPFVTLLLIVLLIAVLGAAYFIVLTIRAATAPIRSVQEANQALQTQVAQVLHPTPTIIPDPVTYIQDVRALARLETIQYSIEQVITAEEGQGAFDFLFGDRLLLIARGVVIAGIDMEKLRPEDMRLENGVLHVTLPPPEIFIATLDNEKTRIYDRETGLFRQGNPELETLARQAAEAKIRETALEDGILEQANTNAEAFLFKFFSALGYSNVIFEDIG